MSDDPDVKTVVVTGGTGTLGRVVVELLEARGHAVRAVSRSSPRWPVDLGTGTGLATALQGADVVVHCANVPKGLVESTRRLLTAAGAAGVRHFAHISIVGIEDVPIGYYRAKLAEERVVEESGVPWTLLRATQFHELAATMLGALARVPPLMVVPVARVQPVEVREVAARLVDLAVAEPAGRVDDFGGPEVRTMADFAASYAAARGLKRRIVSLRLPGKAFRALREGRGTTPEHADGKVAFEEFLAAGK
ncbi:NAD(P)H-binding protein [Umezawaea sp. Da 62-37]|uniref:SDR family oxidoreductase n=1 Tax=Umezawaea sp. Da 62-37 TaxID=3075927 RepID=UPI0028F6DEB4|nr:NAD(P)H-binding protein [Umezawaea sp. Da 62-37]WNV83631.1 NAD(P)H-binding protein [Umezawaea sp. Da 62-37]